VADGLKCTEAEQMFQRARAQRESLGAHSGAAKANMDENRSPAFQASHSLRKARLLDLTDSRMRKNVGRMQHA
jgi:hypothetical protein